MHHTPESVNAVPAGPAFTHREDCEYSMNVPEPVCTCPKTVTTQPVVTEAGPAEAVVVEER